MFQDFCSDFKRAFVRDSIHTNADFLLFLRPGLLIGHQNEQHYRAIQRKLKVDFTYCEKETALEQVLKEKPMFVVVDDIAHYLFMGQGVVELMEWVHQLQKQILSVYGINTVWRESIDSITS